VIKLSVKGLAKYMTSSPANQRRVLRQFKFPREDEPFAMRLYYRDACDRIRAYHKNEHDPEWLDEKADEFTGLAAVHSGSTAVRLRNNGRALRQYGQHFGHRPFEVIGEVPMTFEHANVRVTAGPDLFVRERGKVKAIKFDFSSGASSPEVVKVVSQCMYEAARGHIPGLSSTSILYLDVSRGLEHRGARAGARMLGEIHAACETISAVWDGITPPAR
jgi:hypothetical protein